MPVYPSRQCLQHRYDADPNVTVFSDDITVLVPTSTPTTSVPNVGVSPSVSVPNPFPTGSIIGRKKSDIVINRTNTIVH